MYCTCVAHFFRLFNAVNNLFIQRKDYYSICFIDSTGVRDIFESKPYINALITNEKFQAYAESNPSPLLEANFYKVNALSLS